MKSLQPTLKKISKKQSEKGEGLFLRDGEGGIYECQQCRLLRGYGNY